MICPKSGQPCTASGIVLPEECIFECSQTLRFSETQAAIENRANQNEIRITDPDTGAQKGSKPARFDLLPWDVLWQVAELYGKGAEKYDEHNWRKGYAWSLSYAAMCRHMALFWSGEDVDPELGTHHLTSVIFHAMALLEFTKTHPEKDNRFVAD